MATVAFLDRNRSNRMHHDAAIRRARVLSNIRRIELSESRHSLLSAIRLCHCGYNLRDTVLRNLETLGGLAGVW